MLKLSASSMDTYQKCAKQYQYRYIIKPKIPKKDWSHLEVGSYVHRVLELFHEDLMENVRTEDEYPVIMREASKAAIKEFKFEILKSELLNIKNMLQNYLDKIRKEGLPNVIGTESPFDYMVGEYKVRGIIDRIDRVEPGVYHVVDYKTSKSSKYLKKFQLQLYAVAIKKMYPDAKEIRGSFCMLKMNSDFVSYTFTEKDIEKTKEKVSHLGTSITLDEKWEKKESFLCNWCDYKSICLDNWGVDDDVQAVFSKDGN